MKKSGTVLILGVIAIIILIAVQVFIVAGIWKQKDEVFNLRYSLLSKEALAMIERRFGDNGFDTASAMINVYAEKILKEGIADIKDDTVLARKKKEVLEYVRYILILEQDLSGYLSRYFQRRGYDHNFTSEIVIQRLELIDFDNRIPIYESDDLSAGRRLQASRTGQRPSKILVNAYSLEENHYHIFFEYYIDFSDKKTMILREVSTSLKLSIFSIIFVVIIFMITYRNLVEEKRLSNLKTDFINNMTHELKTPLSTITVAGKTLEIEKIRKDEAKILETAKMIGKQSIHLNNLINMILEISMWERTQFELDKKPVEIGDVMKDIVDSFRSGCSDCAEINLKHNFGNTMADIDLVYFTTMINNLLSNAVKYNNKEPVIEIEGYCENNQLYIKIADNGIGISKEDQKHIFDKFYRASTGNIHRFKGLGLGLYYVKRIAAAHGGNVTVSSKPGKGSTFTINIPCRSNYNFSGYESITC
jgi:two-component system phosphate regulon sensor histidine kinase PhoR